MPHYTDLTVWESFGMPGVDFAFIDRPEAYHTQLDRVDLLEPRSVQSQGENALAMLEGLMNADLAHPPRGHAAWFDVMGLFVVRWPRPWTLWFCVAWTGVVVGRCWTQRKTGAVRLRGLGAGLLVVLAALLTSTLVAWGLTQSPFTLHRWPAAGAVLVVDLMAVMAIGWLFRRVPVPGLHLAVCLFTALAAMGVGLLWPGVAHAFLVPSLCAGLGWLAERRWASSGNHLGSLCGLASATVLWFPMMEGVRIALGPGAVPVVTMGLGVVLLWTLPLWRKGDPS